MSSVRKSLAQAILNQDWIMKFSKWAQEYKPEVKLLSFNCLNKSFIVSLPCGEGENGVIVLIVSRWNQIQLKRAA